MKSIIRILALSVVFLPFALQSQTKEIYIPDLSDVNLTADTLPSFPGGSAALSEYLSRNIKYPVRAMENNESGKVIVRFVVENNGRITRAHIIKSVSYYLDEEALRLVNSMPKWIPGKIDGKDVAVAQLIPFEFKNPEDENKVFEVIEIPPTFQGGDNALIKYISKTTQYPDSAKKNNIQGRVIVKFVVWKDGSIRDVEVVRGVEESLDKEAVRVVSSMPNWIPGKQSGKNVNCKFFIPINFFNGTGDDNLSKNNIDKTKKMTGFLQTIIVDDRKISNPDFPGGADSLNTFLKKNMIYPEVALKDKKEGMVEIAAKIDKTGKITKSWVLNTTAKDFSKEALRLVSLMPTFNPRTVNGKAEKCEIVLSIPFLLSREPIKADSLFDENNIVYIKTEIPPTFPGGDNELMKFLCENVKYPVLAQENNIQGSVLCQFIVRKDGSLTDIKVFKKVDPNLDNEAIRIIKNMPKWIPGKIAGKNVNSRYFVPVNFRLE